jgi:hypothetical protein
MAIAGLFGNPQGIAPVTTNKPASSNSLPDVHKIADGALGGRINRSLHHVVLKGGESHISVTGSTDAKNGTSSVVIADPTCNMNVHVDPQGNVNTNDGQETVSFNRTNISENMNSKVGGALRVDQSEGGWGACKVTVNTQGDGTTSAHVDLGAPASSGEPSEANYMRGPDRPIVGPAYGR